MEDFVEHVGKIQNMMCLSQNVVCGDLPPNALSCGPQRRLGIKHIKKVCEMIPIGYEGRHTSFQILDSVIGSFDFVVDPSEMERLSSCAAILGSKYTSQHSVPCLKSLPLLRVVDWSQLMLMEGEMLIQIDFRVYPQVTAVSFAPKLLDVLEMDPCIRSMILNTVERLIAEFVEDVEFLLYAPSTIAVAAIIHAFNRASISSVDWLNSVPDFVLLSDTTPFFKHLSPDRCRQIFDVDSCLQHFQPALNRYINGSSSCGHHPVSRSSPTSVDGVVEWMESQSQSQAFTFVPISKH